MVLDRAGDRPRASDAAPLLHLRDEVLDIAVTPDRGYCLSLRGLAREAAQASGVAFRDPVARPPGRRVRRLPGALGRRRLPALRRRLGDRVDPTRPSPRWLARRVQLAGMRSISLAVDITNYVMLETGQPIHAYDAERLDGPIVVRHALAGEKLTTLDDAVRDLHTDDLVITDRTGPIGLAGVMGGASTEIGAGHHVRRGGGRPLRRDDRGADVASAQAELGGESSLRAGGGPGGGVRGGPSGGRPPGRAGRWDPRRRGDRCRSGAGRGRHHDRGRPARPRPGHHRRSGHRGVDCCGRSAPRWRSTGRR